jgi:PBP1b-binding outer membrane lipoprotein LpoB
MKYKVILPLMAAIIMITSGCSSQNISVGPKREVNEYIEKTILATGLPGLDISIDSFSALGYYRVYSYFIFVFKSFS